MESIIVRVGFLVVVVVRGYTVVQLCVLSYSYSNTPMSVQPYSNSSRTRNHSYSLVLVLTRTVLVLVLVQLYSCTLYSYSIPYEYSYSEPRYLRSADQLKNCTNVHRCAGQFYLYKLGHRRFISMPFSISLDFGFPVILWNFPDAPVNLTCRSWVPTDQP